MATITVLDSVGASQTIAKVGNTGSTTGANSLPVVIASDQGAITTQLPAALGSTAIASSLSVGQSTEDIARQGIITETAPATDTASSGQNGRLQRIAQRLSSLIALVPTAIGRQLRAASLSVTLSTEDNDQIGIVTETAPLTDTASSGLNGRLQRIAQRLTSLLPAGTTAAATSLGVALSTEDVARVGIITETAPASDVASSGVNGRLQRIAQNLTTLHTDVTSTNAQLPTTPSGSVQTTITRPANTTAYTANDVVGGVITISTGLTSGQRLMLSGADLQGQIAAVPAGMANMRLYLYNVTPPSALADNAAWDLPSGDRASFLGYIDIGTPVDLGSTIFVQTDGINKQLQLSGSANLFGYLVTIGGFTPAANSEVYLLRTQFLGL